MKRNSNFFTPLTLALTLIFGANSLAASYDRIPEHVFLNSSSRATYNLAFEVEGPKGHLHLTIVEDYLDFYDRDTLATYNSNAVEHLQVFFAGQPSLKVELVKYEMFGRDHDLPVAVVRFTDPKVQEFFAAIYEHRVNFIQGSRFELGKHNALYSPHITIGKRGQAKAEWNDPFSVGSKVLDLGSATVFAAINNFIPTDGDLSAAEKARRAALRRNERLNLFAAGHEIPQAGWMPH